KNLGRAELRRRGRLFGTLSEGLRPLKPYRWRTAGGDLLEIPVTTMPLFKVPIHVSYLLYLACYSSLAARCYFATALRMCLWSGTQPSLLLHPLDFLGGDDVGGLDFFPAMRLSGARKVELVGGFLDQLAEHFFPATMGEHASACASARRLPTRRPD